MRILVALVSSALLVCGLTGVSVAARGRSRTTLVGNAGLPGATVYLEVERAVKPDAKGVPTRLVDTIVATTSADSKGRFAATLPNTAQVRDAGSGGWVNTVTIARTANRLATHFDSVPTAGQGAAANRSVGESTGVRTVHEGRFASTVLDSSFAHAYPMASGTPSDNTHCYWRRVSRKERTTRIGELHVAGRKHSKGTFKYRVQADSHMTAGINYDGDGWSSGGNVTVSNSIGAGGAYTRGRRHARTYAIDHMYYGKFRDSGVWSASCPPNTTKTRALHSAGDVFPSHIHLPPGRKGSCHSDPHGLAVVPALNGVYGRDHAKAKYYHFAARAFGFTFGGRTGYTKHIHIVLHNHGSHNTYACGSKPMPYAPVIYNRRW